MFLNGDDGGSRTERSHAMHALARTRSHIYTHTHTQLPHTHETQRSHAGAHSHTHVRTRELVAEANKRVEGCGGKMRGRAESGPRKMQMWLCATPKRDAQGKFDEQGHDPALWESW